MNRPKLAESRGWEGDNGQVTESRHRHVSDGLFSGALLAGVAIGTVSCQSAQPARPLAPTDTAQTIVIAQGDDQVSDKPPVPLGSLAPDFAVTDLSGMTRKLSSFRGHPVLLDFWATWCPPCKKGLVETNHLAKVGKSKGLEVMTISADEDMPIVADFMKHNKYTMPAYLDSNGSAQKAYGVDVIPVTAIIDAQGKLRNFYVGLQTPAEIEGALKKVGVSIRPS
jgi:thiol-disulfide isomerase/thioredoxin